MSIIERVKEFSTKQVNEKSEKISVLSAEIVVHGSIEKPYYEIEYYDLSDREYHIGYSSYNLSNVFRWKEECFEIVTENEYDVVSDQIRELRRYSELCLQYCNEKRAQELLKEAADTIESLSKKLQAANMERSADSNMIDSKKLLEDLEKEVFTADLYERGWDGQTVDNLLCLGDVKKVIDGYEP